MYVLVVSLLLLLLFCYCVVVAILLLLLLSLSSILPYEMFVLSPTGAHLHNFVDCQCVVVILLKYYC